MDYLDEYDDLLSGDEWSQRRYEWFCDNGAWCRGCGSLDDEPDWSLQLHHRSYEYQIGYEPDEVLVALCIDCHDAITDEVRRRDKKYLWEITDEMIPKLQRHARRSRRMRSWIRRVV